MADPVHAGVSATGGCEINSDIQCVWVTAYERAQDAGRVSDLTLPSVHRFDLIAARGV